MNILLLTPLYKIEGRGTLQRNTEAIHYLIKYWVHEENINLYVVNTYLNPGRNMLFLLKKGEIKNYKTEYDYVVDGVNVHLTEVQQIPFQRRFWSLQNNKMLQAVQEVISNKKIKPDLIIAHFPIRYIGMIDKIPSDAPRVAVMHYTDVRLCRKHMSHVQELNTLFKATYTRSQSLKRDCQELGITNLSEFVVHSGVPYAECPPKTAVSFHKGKIIQLLYIGKLIKRKHADYIIQALGKLKGRYSFELKIGGSGPEKAALQKLAEANGVSDQVKFIGTMSREDVYRQMSQADIFIMPSVEETLGLVYLEAMMHGCITVGTEGEGIDGIIKHGKNGFLVKPSNMNSVYENLKEILEMPDDVLTSISKAAVESGKYYNEADMSMRYLKEMQRITGKEAPVR